MEIPKHRLTGFDVVTYQLFLQLFDSCDVN